MQNVRFYLTLTNLQGIFEDIEFTRVIWSRNVEKTIMTTYWQKKKTN